MSVSAEYVWALLGLLCLVLLFAMMAAGARAVKADALEAGAPEQVRPHE